MCENCYLDPKTATKWEVGGGSGIGGATVRIISDEVDTFFNKRYNEIRGSLTHLPTGGYEIIIKELTSRKWILSYEQLDRRRKYLIKKGQWEFGNFISSEDENVELYRLYHEILTKMRLPGIGYEMIASKLALLGSTLDKTQVQRRKTYLVEHKQWEGLRRN